MSLNRLIDKVTDSIGVIGVGAMGSGIAECLVRSAFKSLVFDIDPVRRQAASDCGSLVCASNADVATQARVVFVVVVDAAQVNAVLDECLPKCKSATAFVLCSTISPDQIQAIAKRIQSAGSYAIDAPISGGPLRAASGQMSMMLAGESSLIQSLQPIFESISAKQFVISEKIGDAAKAKLVNNLLAAINLAGAAEAMAFAEKLGLNSKQIFDLMSVSSGQNWMMQDRFARALDNDYAPRAAAHVLTKDVTLANDLANEHGLALALGKPARDALKATCDSGWKMEDDAAILKYYRAKFSAQ